jgi:hypothetical protein
VGGGGSQGHSVATGRGPKQQSVKDLEWKNINTPVQQISLSVITGLS